MNNQLTWYAANRKQLPGLLVGVERPDSSPRPTPEFTEVDASVAYARRVDGTVIFSRPVAVVIEDVRMRELLAWIHTYSPEVFPLSQFVRVQTLTDWRLLAEVDEKDAEGGSSNISAVASLIVGEMLAQADSGLDLAGIPLSWASGCFTLAMHRSLSATGATGNKLSTLASNRLRSCEGDPRLAQRQVRVDSLTQMWSLVGSSELSGSSLLDVCSTVLLALNPVVHQTLRSNDALLSNSAEDRVKGFDSLVDQAMSIPNTSGNSKSSVACLIAAGALLVGHSTSHLELLSPLQSELPESLLWFGLMAGIAGPKAWDSPWLGLVKGVERQLHALSYSAPAAADADLCWAEYEWLSRQAGIDSAFAGFPKRHARTLSIEILPGAPCQFRLQAPRDSRNKKLDRQQSVSPELPGTRVTAPSQFSESADIEWTKIRQAAGELERLLATALPKQDAIEQSSLFTNEEQPKIKRPLKKRNSAKNS